MTTLPEEERRAEAKRRYHQERLMRFWRKVRIVEGDGCWEWTGHLTTPIPYGKYGDMLAHRYSYMLDHGMRTLPSEACVCHHCDNPRCVRPAHLFLGTQVTNNHDRTVKGRTSRKLSNEQVREIRRWVPSWSQAVRLARLMGVGPTAIHNVWTRRTFRWLPDDAAESA